MGEVEVCLWRWVLYFVFKKEKNTPYYILPPQKAIKSYYIFSIKKKKKALETPFNKIL